MKPANDSESAFDLDEVFTSPWLSYNRGGELKMLPCATDYAKLPECLSPALSAKVNYRLEEVLPYQLHTPPLNYITFHTRSE